MVWVIGDDSQSGAYVLHIVVRTCTDVAFGRYNAGRPAHVPAAEYVYVGSAMGGRGAASLGNRLLRHAARSTGRPPHPIQSEMTESFRNAGLYASAGASKTVKWHVDYLLDRLEVELVDILAVRSRKRLEPVIAHWLAADERFSELLPGLGASDSPGQTHLLRITGGPGVWPACLDRLTQDFAQKQTCLDIIDSTGVNCLD